MPVAGCRWLAELTARLGATDAGERHDLRQWKSRRSAYLWQMTVWSTIMQ